MKACKARTAERVSQSQADGSTGAIQKPSKEQVRAWLAGRLARPVPLPSLEQIRCELGWRMAEPQSLPAPEDAEPAF